MAELTPCNGLLSTEAQPKSSLHESGKDLNELNKEAATQEATESENLVVKVPRANSKLILQNMEEVLNSVKKEHRQKHRRKREQRKLALLAELEQAKSPKASDKSAPKMNLSEYKDCSGTTESTTAEARQPKIVEKNHRKTRFKKPLQEQQITEENKGNKTKRRKTTASPAKNFNISESESKSGSMLHHITRTAKKNEKVQVVERRRESDLSFDSTKAAANKDKMSTKKTPNAFEVMMNARNKTIGSNTPGKEPTNNTDTSPAIENSSEKSNAKIKRKLMLQSWADQKGGLKRKMDDELRASYIENQLEKRAKRFKKMLTNKGSPQKKSTSKPSSRSSRPATRSFRLVSTESAESLVDSQQALDSETESFLSKLSSPSKKKDSLLGYFSKVPSPKDVTEKQSKLNEDEIVEKCNLNKSETPKRRSRTSTKISESSFEFDSAKTCSIQTPCGRPKRSCASKAKYDYDLDVEVSPKKGQNTPISRRRKSINEGVHKTPKQKYDCKTETDVICLDETASPIDLDCMPKKLAPLFMRNVPKPSPDPQTLKARQEFLRSGVPEKLRIELEKLKQMEQSYDDSIQLYPKLSHLRQWSPKEHQLVLNLISRETSFHLRTEENYFENCCSKKKSYISLIDCVGKEVRVLQKSESSPHIPLLPIIPNKHQIVKTWKSEFERFPTYKCYNQLRAKYRFFSALDSGQDTTQVSESFVVTRSNRRSVELANAASNAKRSSESLFEEDVKPPETAPNGELLFVEKYKPMLFDQVLVNLTPISQLREFLANWANGSGGSSAKNSQNLADDSMDFLNDSNSSQQTTCNSVVLLGPTASGKTNAVFTLANELNFNVLEINAGMKRTGKKLIQELQEATQSHQIRNDLKGTAGTVKSKAQKGLLRLSLNDLKSKNSANHNDDAVDACNDLASRKCLILIEDADIVFEQTDAGFTDAIYTLAASSKRPVIVVAKDPNCGHLQRLMSQNTIRFSAPNPLSISKYLAVLSLLENCPVSLDDLISLFLFNRMDLRKTMNELQFFIQSGGDREVQASEGDLSNCGQNQKTPSKKNRKENDNSATTGKYFASPSKRRFSEETQPLVGSSNDETLKREVHSKQQQRQNKEKGSLCIHQNLFEFYTVDQSEKSRIPFPLDLDIFRINLPDIFGVANNLKLAQPSSSGVTCSLKQTKQKSRLPKKTWLSTATDIGYASANAVNKDFPSCKHLDCLTVFYENLSIASLLTTRSDCSTIHSENVSQQHDRLKPHVREQIAHYMLERAINVNLDAEPCPYNLFDAPKNKHTLCDLLGAPLSIHGKRGRSIDVEPLLRAICRSEKQRAAQERRSTRFYHYLRNSSVDVYNFSQQPFDSVCNVLQEDEDKITN